MAINAVIRRALPPLVQVGLGVGIVAGLTLGAMASSAGSAIVGCVLGAIVGGVSGLAMHRQDQRDVRRGHELDAIIGVTEGSLGTPPGSIPPGDLARTTEESSELSTWASQWLTPPPPSVG